MQSIKPTSIRIRTQPLPEIFRMNHFRLCWLIGFHKSGREFNFCLRVSFENVGKHLYINLLHKINSLIELVRLDLKMVKGFLKTTLYYSF